MFQVGDEVVISKKLDLPGGWRPLEVGSIGRLVEPIDHGWKVFFDGRGSFAVLQEYLKPLSRQTFEVPMVISELAAHMIDAGTGVNHRTLPEWFQSVANALRAMPELSKMGRAQMEFVIKTHMEYRRVDNRADLVANVLFGIQSCAGSHQLRTMEQKLHGYKEKLDTEWKKLNQIIPIEFQYAALRAYAEMLND